MMRMTYLSRSGKWPSGNPRYYYRRPGAKIVPMPDLKHGSDAFYKAWHRLHHGDNGTTTAPDHNPKHLLPDAPSGAGTIGRMIDDYEKSSDFRKLAKSSRQVRSRFLADVRKRYGRGTAATLSEKNIRLDLAPLDGYPRLNRLKHWRGLLVWAKDVGCISENHAAAIRFRAVERKKGHTPWTDDDLRKFRNYWPIGSMQRLAVELIVQTAASPVDLVKLGPPNVKSGGRFLHYQRQKSGSLAVVPWVKGPALDWFDASPYLAECIAGSPRHLTFITTQKGASRSHKSFSSWFSQAASKAGLDDDRTAHGVRKLVSRRMKELGASPDQRQAIMGHENEDQDGIYTEGANMELVILAGTG